MTEPPKYMERKQTPLHLGVPGSRCSAYGCDRGAYTALLPAVTRSPSLHTHPNPGPWAAAPQPSWATRGLRLKRAAAVPDLPDQQPSGLSGLPPGAAGWTLCCLEGTSLPPSPVSQASSSGLLLHSGPSPGSSSPSSFHPFNCKMLMTPGSTPLLPRGFAAFSGS